MVLDVGRRVGKVGWTGANGLPAERELPETSSKNRLMQRVGNVACRIVAALACEPASCFSRMRFHARGEWASRCSPVCFDFR